MEAFRLKVRPSPARFLGPSENRLESEGDARPTAWLLGTFGGALAAPAKLWRLSGNSGAGESRRSASTTFTVPSHPPGTRDLS